MNRLLIAAALLAVSTAAVASPNWYIYRAATQTCWLATSAAAQSGFPQLSTPYDLRLWLRTRSNYQGFTVTHPEGATEVSLSWKKYTFTFFSTRQSCDVYARIQAKGSNLNELK